MSKDVLLHLGLFCGEAMMQSGAEVYRVEDTLTRLLKKVGADDVQTIATPTGLYLSITIEGHIYTAVRRIARSNIDLSMVSELNAFSRSLEPGTIPQTALDLMQRVLIRDPEYTRLQQVFFAFVAGGAFSFIFGGGLIEMLGGSLGALLVYVGSAAIERKLANKFVVDFVGGAIAALSSLLLGLFISYNSDLAIVGAIMTLVPGLLLTNAVRDALTGNLLSGTSRMVEALFVSISIAGGVGTILSLWVQFGGLL